MAEFKRVLVSNRGEIALRVIRALKILAIESVAVYSDADVSALHVRAADKSYNLPGVYASDTYLNAEKILEIAKKADCDAIHPGYGFLAENDGFSRLCKGNSIKFIGPKPETLEISGNKLKCKNLVESKKVPVVPYTKEPVEDPETAAKLANEIGFPVLLKSAFGGGGRGIKEATSKEQVKESFESSEREAKSAFGRFAIFIEKRIVRPRHIEIQILANDSSSEAIHLGERDCSIQRRYQKLIEVSPSPIVTEEERRLVSGYAIKAAKAVRYSNAGTVEFLRDQEGNYYFMEVNSRLQVEHPVTEAVTGVDIVANQIQIAKRKSGSLQIRQKDVEFKGSAIECRINAEDPLSGFIPLTGTIDSFHLPGGPRVRVDSALYPGMQVSPYYDSLIAKLIVWGTDFRQSRERTAAALNEFEISGVKTTIGFHREVVRDENFSKGKMDTSFVESNRIIEKMRSAEMNEAKFLAAALLFSKRGRTEDRLTELQKKNIRIIRDGSEEGRFIDGL